MSTAARHWAFVVLTCNFVQANSKDPKDAEKKKKKKYMMPVVTDIPSTSTDVASTSADSASCAGPHTSRVKPVLDTLWRPLTTSSSKV